MKKYSFLDDYSEGCHPAILQALSDTNLMQQTAYGDDDYCNEARQLITQKLNTATSNVHFVASGTLANIIVMAALLKSHQAVISATTGHIVMREAGAIEATGHKVITVPTDDGKLNTDAIQQALDNHAHAPHMVKPKVVYISNASEMGTVYNKQELQTLYDFCQTKDLYLFLDGARLGSALCCASNDLTFADLAQLTDIFSLGGTKNGALIGEAIVINNQALSEDFAFHIKQRGGLLAKGRILGIQFTTLFKDDLFFQLANHANSMAQKISQALLAKGHTLFADTQTNQIFPILPNTLIEQLQQQFAFYVWQPQDAEHSVIRLVTSWATDIEQVEAFIKNL